jgi:hypothetical protein
MPGPIRVDARQAINALDAAAARLVGSQMPFAAALALTRTAQEIQRQQIREMVDVFDRPTPYTLSSTFVRPATKTRLQAFVGLKDFAAKAIPAAKFLAPAIGGGSRRLKRFEIALRRAGQLPEDFRVVPGSGAKLDPYGNIQPSQIVQILSYFRAFPEAGYRANMTAARRQKMARGTKTKRGMAYFVGRPGGRGPLGVWERVQFARGTAVRPVLIFVRHAHYQAIYDFEFVATSTAQREFPRAFEAALADALRGAR